MANSFDWIFKSEANFLKLMEGNYAKRKQPQPTQQTLTVQKDDIAAMMGED